MTAIACTDLRLELGGRGVLDGVNLSIEAGEFIGVLGPNGAGKTTLMRAMLGLLPIAAGQISVFGAPARTGNGAIGYMPQHRAALAAVPLSGWEFVASVQNARWGRLPWLGRAARAEVDQALDLVGAGALARRRLSELSGGERQRLLIAQALIGKPRLLLLDEPLASLDPAHAQAIVGLVKHLQTSLGITVLFSAHELTPLLGALDRVLYLGNRQAALGTVAEVITGPTLSRLYGSTIEVVHLNGRIFVMAGATDVARAGCEHDGHGHA